MLWLKNTCCSSQTWLETPRGLYRLHQVPKTSHETVLKLGLLLLFSFVCIFFTSVLSFHAAWLKTPCRKKTASCTFFLTSMDHWPKRRRRENHLPEMFPAAFEAAKSLKTSSEIKQDLHVAVKRTAGWCLISKEAQWGSFFSSHQSAHQYFLFSIFLF